MADAKATEAKDATEIPMGKADAREMVREMIREMIPEAALEQLERFRLQTVLDVFKAIAAHAEIGDNEASALQAIAEEVGVPFGLLALEAERRILNPTIRFDEIEELVADDLAMSITRERWAKWNAQDADTEKRVSAARAVP